MVAYGEFRSPYNKDKKDNRFIFYGIRYIVENFLKQWTEEDVKKSALFFKTVRYKYKIIFLETIKK